MHESTILQGPPSKLLKSDVFGSTRVIGSGPAAVVRRDTRDGRPGLRWLARRLLVAEAEALAALDGLHGVPALLGHDRQTLDRSFLPGAPMQDARPGDAAYFKALSRLLRALHRRGVVHNDLAKEPNLLVTEDGGPAIIDFQLAWAVRRRGRLFRTLAREDLRHLLKHKRTYCAAALTARERRILESPSWLSRAWMRTVKPVYRFVTRRLMGWQDREGAGDRV